MELIELRRMMMANQTLPRQTYAGIPVLIDNYYYSNPLGALNENGTINSNYFMTGIFDTGDCNTKTYSYNSIYIPSGNIYCRIYDTISDIYNSNSNNHYYIISSTTSNYSYSRIESWEGRFICFPVYKPWATSLFLHDDTNNLYWFKGPSVT